MLRNFVFLLSFFTGLSLSAQSVMNASFEGTPQDATMPQNWSSCYRGTTPDIMPGIWGVHLEPYHGNSYVGIITRQNGSFESIGQRFSKALEKGACYEFSIEAAISEGYGGYDEPVRLRVYLGESKCDRDFLLKDFGLIENEDWENFRIRFQAEEKFTHIIIEVAFKDKNTRPYGGHVLLDNLVFRPCPRS